MSLDDPIFHLMISVLVLCDLVWHRPAKGRPGWSEIITSYLLLLFIISIVVIAIVITNIFTTYIVISIITTFSNAIIMIENRTCKSTIARQAAATPLAMEVGRWRASRKIVINESGGESIEFSNLSRAESWNGDYWCQTNFLPCSTIFTQSIFKNLPHFIMKTLPEAKQIRNTSPNSIWT